MNFWHSIADFASPRNDDPIADYASANVQLFPPITQEGFFKTDNSRHFIPIFQCLDDGRVREVNILKPVRGGGSLIGDVHLASVMPSERQPGPYMNVFQTDQDAKVNFYDRIERILAGNESTRHLLPSKYEWSEIRLLNGNTLYTCGPSVSSLQSKGIRYLRLDECWIYPPGRMAEAEARVGDYLVDEMSKILRISQGGPRDGVELDHDEWSRAYHRGSVHEWEVQCQHCQGFCDPIFSGARADGSFWGITWDHHKLPNGDWDLGKCCPTVRFECPHCRQPATDSTRTKGEWNRTGRYRLVGEDNRKRQSFHWETVINYPWDELVELWLDACNAERRGDLKPKVQFYQKRRAMFKDEASLLRGGLNFRRLSYEINTDWPEERMRFLTVDRQAEDMFWWTVRAWSSDKSRRLGFGKCYGFAAIEEIRIKFKVRPEHTFIDSAFLPKGDHGVYGACVAYGWLAVRGDRQYDFVHKIKRKGRFALVRKSYAALSYGDPGAGTTEDGRRYCRLVRFSKPQMNQKVQELVENGSWEEPADSLDKEMEAEYNSQMAARVRKTEHNAKTGETKVYWFETKNDHARDLANMQVLGAILADLVTDPVMERLSKSEKAEVVESKEVAA